MAFIKFYPFNSFHSYWLRTVQLVLSVAQTTNQPFCCKMGLLEVKNPLSLALMCFYTSHYTQHRLLTVRENYKYVENSSVRTFSV